MTQKPKERALNFEYTTEFTYLHVGVKFAPVKDVNLKV